MRIISGKAKGRKLLPPATDVTRPTLDRVKEAIFSMLYDKTEDAVVVDVFSGTGSLGLEAASRWAKKVYLFDRDDESFSRLSQNVKNLEFEDFCFPIKGDSYRSLERLIQKGEIFDLIFIDPPYAKEMIPKAIEIVSENKGLKEDGLIVCKIDSKEEIYQGNGDIDLVRQKKYGNTTVLFYEYAE